MKHLGHLAPGRCVLVHVGCKAAPDTLLRRGLQVIRMVGESQETVSVGGGSGSSSNKMPTLEEYGTNLTTQATEVTTPPASKAFLLPKFPQNPLLSYR